jgi:hypothetical protein
LAREQARVFGAQPVIMLDVHDVKIHGPLPAESDARSSVAQRRRVLAQRLLAELVDDSASVPGHDLVSAVSLALPAAQVPGVGRALLEVAEVARRSSAAVLVAAGAGSTAARVHADGYSVVFRFTPQVGPVLVLLDELPDYAVRVDLDPDPDVRNRVQVAVFGVLTGAGRVAA